MINTQQIPAQKARTQVSFEFFPPKTQGGRDNLIELANRLQDFDPAYFSVTYGAGGTTRNRTQRTVADINNTGAAVAPHLSLSDDKTEDVCALLSRYADMGIDKLVAIRGDAEDSSEEEMRPNRVYAETLVRLIREHFPEQFEIAVGCYPEVHPEAAGYKEDLGYLKQKLDAGADYAVTQYFYNIDAFKRFLDEYEKAGIDKPLVPGIMPITNYEKLMRFSEACGADIPRWLQQSLCELAQDEEGLLAFGEEVVSRLCEQLIDLGMSSLHFYTLNQYQPTAKICQNLDLAA